MPTWNESLAVGIPELDEQHEQLFGRADALVAAMKQHRPADEVRQLIQFLADYCVHHFRSEEALMIEAKYSGLRAHIAEHVEFLVRFERLRKQFEEKGASLTVTIDLHELVCKWLAQHVAATDMALSRIRPGHQKDAQAVAQVGTGDRKMSCLSRGNAATCGTAGKAFDCPFITYGGQQILQLDFADLSEDELLYALRRTSNTIASAPDASLRILTILTSPVTPAVAAEFKRLALRNRPHVRASAVVASTFWKVILADLQVRGREDIRLFDHKAAALAWLAGC